MSTPARAYAFCFMRRGVKRQTAPGASGKFKSNGAEGAYLKMWSAAVLGPCNPSGDGGSGGCETYGIMNVAAPGDGRPPKAKLRVRDGVSCFTLPDETIVAKQP